MTNPASSQTGGGAASAGSGSSGNQGASNPDATGTTSVDELLRRVRLLEQDKNSLQQSVQGLVRIKDEQASRIEELMSGGDSGDSGSAVAGGVSRQEVEEVTKAAIKNYFDEQTRISTDQMRANATFNQDRQKWLVKAEQDFPDAANRDSALWKKAQEVYSDPSSGLSRKEQNVLGQDVAVPMTASSEYDAFARAAAVLSAQASAAGHARDNAAFAATGGSSGGGSQGAGGQAGELTDEEYLKMTPEQKAAYQERRFLEKNTK